MPRVSDLIRRHAMESAGVRDRVPDLAILREIRWVPEFERLMRNRLVMGAFRYECDDMREPPSKRYDNLASIRARLSHYEVTEDIEDLVDVANLCMIEFRYAAASGRTVGRGGDHEFHAAEKE